MCVAIAIARFSVLSFVICFLELCVSSFRKGHVNVFCIVPMLTDDPRRESKIRTLCVCCVVGMCCYDVVVVVPSSVLCCFVGDVLFYMVYMLCV